MSVQSKDEDRGIWGGRLLLQFQFSSHGGKEGNGTRSCHSRASIQFQSRELKRIQRKGKEKEERLEERQQGRAASGQWAAAGDPCPSGRWTWTTASLPVCVCSALACGVCQTASVCVGFDHKLPCLLSTLLALSSISTIRIL